MKSRSTTNRTLKARFPKNVGLPFFNEAPHRFFPATRIDVVRFPDGPGGDRFEEMEFQGPPPAIAREAISHVKASHLKQTVVEHPDRPKAERFWNFPIEAIEEAVVNAIHHRSHEEREPVGVRITAEEPTVRGFPGPDRSIRMEDLREGRAVVRRHRNRHIGDFLKELDPTEGRGTGIPKIPRAMRSNGSPIPVFESDEHRTWFPIRPPVHEGAQPESPEQAAIQATVHETLQVAIHETIHETIHVERTTTALSGEMNRTQPQAALKSNNRSHFLAAHIQPALDAGLMETTLPDKPTSRKRRHRRTAAGDALAGKAPNEDSSTQVTIHETIHEAMHVERLTTALSGEMNRTQPQAAPRPSNRSHFLRRISSRPSTPA